MFLAVLLIDIHYNVAFKLIAVSGLVTLPFAHLGTRPGRTGAVPRPLLCWR